MKFRILSAFALVCALACAAAAQGDKGAQGPAKVSGGEKDAAQKIEKAKGAEAKLQAAAAFVKKYPQSSLRRQVAEGLAEEIKNTTDDQTKVSLAQTFTDIFNQPDEAELVNGTLLDAYVRLGSTEEALKLGTGWLAKHPDDIPTLQNLTILASNEAIKGNTSFAAQGRQYGMKAVELLEGDKMPAGFDAAKWPEFKSTSLAATYRALGVLLYKAGDSAAALPALEKAAAAKSADPGVYLLLSELHNNEYEMRAKEYNVAPAAQKAAALERVNAALDKVIESYAQAIAVTDSNAQYAQVNAAIRQDYEKYYKFRHKGADGMQQLIDKYKRPAQ
jgi:tetratricopeptide (TPR) repeat protein